LKVVILAGGFGTRIRDIAEDIPKPMIPIGPYPILWHIMKYYASYGHRDFVLCLGYKGKVIRDFFLNYEAYTRDVTLELGNMSALSFHSDHAESNWRVTLSDTGLNTMTGGRIAKIARYVGDEDFLLTYGDGVGDIDLDALLAFHRKHGKVLTLSGVRPPGRFGELRSTDGIVTEFNEKPQATGGRISGGYFVANKRIFEYLRSGDSLVFEQEPMRRLVEEGNLMVFEHDGFWQPMDTSREYQVLNSMYSQGRAPWVRW
jgi:glucose-1-phosphate cytidylyltransferase